MSPRCCPVLELRQYTLHPGKRDTLVSLFEEKFVESQEAEGLRIAGHFRDLDRPDRFVWVRGFADMAARKAGLTAFYGGPVWKANREAANATMEDSDNVLLLRPIDDRWGFAAPARPRAALGDKPNPARLIIATLYSFPAPVDEAMRRLFRDQIAPALVEAGAEPLAALETESAENNFPRLPVRQGEHVFIWFAAVPSADALAQVEARLEGSARWKAAVAPALAAKLARPPERLRLDPAARSLLR